MNGKIRNDWVFISCSYPKITKSFLKIPVANFCRLIIPPTHAEHGRWVASWNLNCVWFADPTSDLIPKYLTAYEALNFILKLLSVFSKQLD